MSVVPDAVMGAYLGISSTEAAPYNAAAQRACERYCGFLFEAANAQVRYQCSELLCPSTVTPTLTDADSQAITAAYTYTAGNVKRVELGHEYSAVRIAYTVGWSSSTVPADVATAVKETARLAYERSSSAAGGSVSKVSVDGVTVEYKESSISSDPRVPDDASALLAPYRLDWGI